jgi:lysyl-tRNA synthetase class 1
MQQPLHWADEAAERVLASGRPPVLSTGISPSGEIHIGNLREVLTADAVYRALLDRGARPRFDYVCDNFDPLRRVYPFLDPQVYAPLVGRPLSEIPCPCGRHASYGDHFLEPFLQSLRTLHVHVELERADRMYKDGRMNAEIVAALLGRDRIAAILHELTGKEVAADWSPFNPLCPQCGGSTAPRPPASPRKGRRWTTSAPAGARARCPWRAAGKLTWRVDWPARWRMLSVTVEPFGKDHATRGGSYDTGVRIVREVFDAEPPLPIAYEWIALRGQGDMSSSKGNVLSIARALELVPPEALRYLVLREKPQRTIVFDPGLPLLQLVDEVDDAQAEGRDERSLALSRAAGFEPVGVPFKHLVVVAQAARFELDAILSILERTGYPGCSRRRWRRVWASPGSGSTTSPPKTSSSR